MSRILAIELENFQSIGSRVRIELKPITLMFGPNSAGKSAIYDAIELLRYTLDPALFDEKKVSVMVDRWARRTDKIEQKGVADIRETFLAIDFETDYKPSLFKNGRQETDLNAESRWSIKHNYGFDIGLIFESDKRRRRMNRVRIEILYRFKNDRTNSECYITQGQLSINGETIFAIADPGVEMGVRHADEFYHERPDSVRDLLISMDKGSLSRIPRAGYWPLMEVKTPDLVIDNPGYGFVGPDVICMPVDAGLCLFSVKDEWVSNEESSIIAEMVKEIYFMFGTVLFGPLRRQRGVVDADRRAPTPKEATAWVDFGLEAWWNKDSRSASSPAMLMRDVLGHDVDGYIKGLAEIAHADLILRASNHESWADSSAMEKLNVLKDLSEQLSSVNAHLEKNLFTEKLYKLSCESTLMVPLDLTESEPQGYYTLSQPAVVRLLLLDQQGLKLELHDVGSGVSYVLPVLLSAVSDTWSMIQQPELHLHPALQSSVADVFVEEMNGRSDVKFLIETHSEHLLLRLLRRIRETEKGKALSSSLKITNEQVAIYYFDPKINGETEVVRLPVTPLGDFYTDWPRGFFEERNRDLFEDD